MNVLITGNKGFIGSYVENRFKENSHNVIGIDIKEGNDLFDIPLDNKIDFNGVDAIVHMAANLEILNVDPEKELELNIKGTVHMLEVARKYDIPKLIYLSSADVYGEPYVWEASEVIHSNKYIRPSEESDYLKPFWSYASSKIAGEIYCRQYEELYGIHSVVVRPSIVTSVREWFGRFVTLTLGRIKKYEPILIFGSGTQSRDFVPAQDVADIIYLATTKNIKTPDVFNAGTGRAITINEMTNIISSAVDVLGYDVPEVKYINPQTGTLGRKLHEQKNQCLNMDYTKKVLGFNSSTTIEQAILDEVEWVMGMGNVEFNKWIEKPRY